MALARWTASVQDAEGNAVAGCDIEVRSENTGALVPLFSDREGELALGNPFTASDATFFFHALGGAYRVKATKGTFETEWRYVAIGTAGETDEDALLQFLEEVAENKLEKDGSNWDGDETARAAFRANIDTDYSFHDIDIGGLVGGVLTIPREGTYFKLTGHGAADFSIEEFGDERPVGKAFFLLVPRTIADTGGGANSLGNKVSFIHSASGSGLDMTIARRNVGGGSFLYTYEAYPDACDAGGYAINLYELLEFVPLGGGRHECRKPPEDMEFRTATAFIRRTALGMQEVLYRGNLTMPGSGTVTWTFPARFASADYSFAASSTSSSTNAAITIHSPVQNQGNMTFFAMSSGGQQVQTNTRPMAIGIWKP